MLGFIADAVASALALGIEVVCQYGNRREQQTDDARQENTIQRKHGVSPWCETITVCSLWRSLLAALIFCEHAIRRNTMPNINSSSRKAQANEKKNPARATVAVTSEFIVCTFTVHWRQRPAPVQRLRW